jgi:hypothetical protein
MSGDFVKVRRPPIQADLKPLPGFNAVLVGANREPSAFATPVGRNTAVVGRCVSLLRTPSAVIRIRVNASMSVLPIRIPSANTIRSRHVDPGGVQEGSRGLSEATPPEDGPPHAHEPRKGFQTARFKGMTMGACPNAVAWSAAVDGGRLRIRIGPAFASDWTCG